MNDQEFLSRRAALAVLASGAGAMILASGSRLRPAPQEPPTEPLQHTVPLPPRVDLMPLCEKHLAAADEALSELIPQSLAPVHEVFQQASQGVPAFVETALGWRSRAKLVWAALPPRDFQAHERFLKTEFERLVVSETQIETALKRCAAMFIRQIQSVESQMLVNLAADIEDLPPHAVGPFEPQMLTKHYTDALKTAESASVDHLFRTAAALTLSAVVTPLVQRVIVRLSTSTVVLGTGAAGASASFGLTLAAALVIDAIIQWLWNWWWDPANKLQQELVSKLDQSCRSLIDGGEGMPGLVHDLEMMAAARASLRRQAIPQAVLAMLASGPPRPPATNEQQESNR